jgi:hypothetical protein
MEQQGLDPAEMAGASDGQMNGSAGTGQNTGIAAQAQQDIVTRLSGFFNSHAEILVSFLLKSKKMVLLLKSGIFVQTDCHHKKHDIKQKQDYEQYKT